MDLRKRIGLDGNMWLNAKILIVKIKCKVEEGNIELGDKLEGKIMQRRGREEIIR